MNDSLTATDSIITHSLYQKLGGAAGIAALVDDMVAAHLENPVIRARFLPYLEQPEKVALVKQHFREFLGMGAGGPELYSGRDMQTVHRGMNISEAEYMAALDDILQVLDRHGVDENSKKEMLYMAYSVKKQIIGI